MTQRFGYFTQDDSPGQYFFWIDKANAAIESDDPEALVVWAAHTNGVWMWLPSERLKAWFLDNGYTRETVQIVPVVNAVLIKISDPDLAFAFRMWFT